MSDTPFASASLAAHLGRGLGAVALFALAAFVQRTSPMAGLAAGIAALVLLRGCPVCWTIGLAQTIAQKRRAAALKAAESAPAAGSSRNSA